MTSKDNMLVDADSIKSIFESRTLWVNVIALGAFVIQRKYGFVIDESVQAQILALVNVGLRAITKDPVRWKKPRSKAKPVTTEV